MKKILKGLKWTAIVIGAAFLLLVIARIPHAIDKQKTDEQVAKIHSTKLTLDDVLGKNLPPDPGAEADKTIAGVDANNNGIRDDVELAIFKAYPNSAKTRAALLQYALMLQMQMTMPLVNKETVTASVEDNESRANICLWSLSSRANMDKFIADVNGYRNFVEDLQLNTDQRRVYLHDIFKGNLMSYEASNEGCDLGASLLKN